MASRLLSCGSAKGHYTSAMRLPDKAGRAGRGGLRKTAGLEVEVKLRVSDRAAVLRRLRKLRARGSARMHEMNTLYDAPDGSLFREGKLVRIRTLRPAGSRAPAGGAAGRGGKRDAILTYKGPVRGADGSAGQGDRCKIREEHELAVEDAAAMARVFEGMGLRPSFRYEKYRTTYQIPRVAGLLVEMDETPIGDFLELEGEAG